MFDILGDPHLGRKFINNVPLHRRGEREEMVWADFEQSVMKPKHQLHVCMGDLFDSAYVSYDTIFRAAQIYRKAPKSTTYVVLRGNHDASRDLEKVSAFDLFREIVRGSAFVIEGYGYPLNEQMVAFGWDPVVPAATLVRDYPWDGETIALGHWDVDPRSSPFNLIPTKELAAAGVTTAYTGHVHKPETFVRDGVTVHVTGSMQPYAHGEESDESLYVTRTLDEVLADPGAFRNKCLRIDRAPEEPIDCLQLVVKRTDVDEDPDLSVQLGDFDIHKLFAQAFTEEGVPEALQKQIVGRYQSELASAS